MSIASLTASFGTALSLQHPDQPGRHLRPGRYAAGLWSGLVTRPLRLSAAFLIGIPSGDPAPLSTADDEAALIARSLPTGDGEVDFEPRLSLGYSFGGVRRWPLVHYVVAEAGYWIRTAGRARDPNGRFFTTDFADAFTYRAELGSSCPSPSSSASGSSCA